MAEIDQFDQAPDPRALAPAAHTFKGKPLAPYTFGRRLIARSVLAPSLNPADQVWPLAVIYVLSLDEPHAQAALYDVPKFQADLYRWIDSLDAGDYPDALKVAEKVLEEAKKAEVRAVADPAAALDQKKT